MLKRTLAVIDTHDAGRCLTAHTNRIGQGNIRFIDSRTDKAVTGGYGACQGRTVTQLAHAILNDHTGVKCLASFAGSHGKGIRDESHTLHTLYLVAHTQDGGRHVNTVGHNLYGHVINEIYTLHRTLVLVLTLVVETWHGIVEMRDMCETGLKTSLHVLIFCGGVGNAGQNPLVTAVTSELYGSGQLGCRIPTLQAGRVLHNMHIFVRVGILDTLRHLGTRLLGIEIMSLKVQTQDRRVGLCHHHVARFHGTLYHGDGTAGERGEDTCGTIFEVRLDSHLKGILGTFLEVTTTSAVHMHLDTAGHDIHATGIHEIGTDDGEVTIRHLQNLVVTQDDRTIAQPSLRGKNLTVYNLRQHTLHH